jgi:hypothetical protein
MPSVTAMPDFGTVSENQMLLGPSVLSNDTDTGPGPLTAAILTGAANGTTAVHTDGTYVYTPSSGFVGQDQFTYTAIDGIANNSTTVTITVTSSGGGAPVANNDMFTFMQGSALTNGNVVGNDTDPGGQTLVPQLVALPLNGMASFNQNGTLNYQPNSGFAGTDTLTYKDYDGTQYSNVATVSIAVAQASPPVANNDTFLLMQGSVLTNANVVGNDSDPAGHALVPQIVAMPLNGTASFSQDGTLNYQPNPSFFGTDTLTYNDYDGTQYSNVATVTISVTAASPPVANDDSFTVTTGVLMGTPTSLNVTANDVSPQGFALTPVIQAYPQNGSVSVMPGGTISYTPNAGFSGADTFTYKDSDGTQTGNTATVALSVVTVAPTIAFQAFTIDPSNTDASLFTPTDTPSPTIIDLSVVLKGPSPSTPVPTGYMTFTSTDANGVVTNLGMGVVDSTGKAQVAVDSSLIAPGVVVSATYSGDQFYVAAAAADAGAAAAAVAADPVVTDNPQVTATTRNLVVVVVCGANGAERSRWLTSARGHYGASAYIITSVHSISDLGGELGRLPNGSVQTLVIGGHGDSNGVQLRDQSRNLDTYFNLRNLNIYGGAAANIRAALSTASQIQVAACDTAEDAFGRRNLQLLANYFTQSTVYGFDGLISDWPGDVTGPGWYSFQHQ